MALIRRSNEKIITQHSAPGCAPGAEFSASGRTRYRADAMIFEASGIARQDSRCSASAEQAMPHQRITPRRAPVSGSASGLLALSRNSMVMKTISLSPRFSRSCTLNSPRPISLVAGLAGLVGVFDRGAVVDCWRPRAAGHRSPEIVEHVAVKADALAGREPDDPDPHAFALGQQRRCRRSRCCSAVRARIRRQWPAAMPTCRRDRSALSSIVRAMAFLQGFPPGFSTL